MITTPQNLSLPAQSRPAPSTPSQPAPKTLATMLLAAIVTALVVAADSLIETYADDHLLFGWIALWAVGFAALALFAGSARNVARALNDALGAWVQREAWRAADRNYLAAAQHDPRIMAELLAAVARTQEFAKARDLMHGRAWLNHRPRGTLNAGYPGPRSVYLTTPLVGLPLHLQYLHG
ncbi:MAG: hypothetical protein ABIN37_06295 [Burkholderiaceae bacterium]